MQTRLPASLLESTAGAEAERILRSCVHCGFCNATCPTYRIQGDELDGPRGRIYLIKQMLESGTAGETTRLHLDRCLTCRSCETTCPSGVEYAKLLEIGRDQIEQDAPRPPGERLLRRLLRLVLPEPGRIRWALRAAPFTRRLLPRALADALPARRADAGRSAWPAARHPRRIIALEGCVQAATRPEIDAAAARLLDRHSISLIRAPGAGCCGAVSLHLSAADEARAYMRRNIDAWWPHIEQGAEAVVASSSACGAMLRDYGRLLGDDSDYGEKARRIVELTRDIGEVVAALEPPATAPGAGRRIAFHAPCSLRHGLRLHDTVEGVLKARGFELVPVPDAHICCGAAGTYTVLQPALSARLRTDKVAALESGAPELIATANIGCLLHLEIGSQVPVQHWIELVEASDPAVP